MRRKKSFSLLAILVATTFLLSLTSCDKLINLGTTNETTNNIGEKGNIPSSSETTRAEETTHSSGETPSIEEHTHLYNSGEIITSATCTQAGTKKYTCTDTTCGHSYTESYSLSSYTATEIYNQSIKYVGEIITYDKSGNEYGLGTGFVISSDGKIVTNYHVIENAYSADITINNIKYDVISVLAYDAAIDLVVLKIDATELTIATICKAPVNVGETVYAIGSSRGLTNTYSQGIITYADRVVDNVSHIQHDASITHGNSGGPLINVYGEVIGINTWGISDSQNLNFAVFTDELDNLVYGEPKMLSELIKEELTPHEILFNWLVKHQNYEMSNNIVYRSVGTYDSFTIGYDLHSEYLYILYSHDGSNVIVDLSCSPSEYSYYWNWKLTNPEDYYELSGKINAYIYTLETELKNYNYVGGLYIEESRIVPNAQKCLYVAILNLQNFLLARDNMGITIEDFGFITFNSQ